jgi:UDP-N-acetylglucosamine 2-epimerase (non-hydrolysing)
VIGTRPEAIKLAPVAHALAARGLEPLLTLTGQHPALDLHEHGLSDFPATRLHCAGTRDPHAHVQLVAAALERELGRPDLLVVQGDTSSAYGGALAGFRTGVAVAHVEAGLRSHDPRLPWPEEEYRTAIDADADLLFAPTELAAANLRAETVGGAILVTGNTGIDAVMRAKAALPPQRLHDGGMPRLLVTCHRRENWDAGLRRIAEALRILGEQDCARVDWVLPPNCHVAALLRELLGDVAQVQLHPPCGHSALIAMMRDCDLMLSDSGGVQEEAPALGVPLLVLRDKTERPEALATGNMRLVGTDTCRIVEEVCGLLADPAARAKMMRPSFPYGDGRAGERIAAHIEHWLGTQTRAGVRSLEEDFRGPRRDSAPPLRPCSRAGAARRAGRG